MTNNEVIIDGLSCYNCPEKERCEIQKRQKNEVIDLIIDRIHKITNYDSCITPHIKKLKSVIPTVTRCDVVLEKQLQRKTQECEKLKEEIKQIKKNLRKRFSVQDVPDGDIIITCPKKQSCYEHLHAHEAMVAYRKADKKRAKYKSALDEIEEFCLVYKDNPVEGSAYKKILDIITKVKGE